MGIEQHHGQLDENGASGKGHLADFGELSHGSGVNFNYSKQQTSPHGRSSCVAVLLFEWALIRRVQHPRVWLWLVRKTPETKTKTLKPRNRASWRTAGGKSVDHSSANQKARLPLMSFCLSS